MTPWYRPSGAAFTPTGVATYPTVLNFYIYNVARGNYIMYNYQTTVAKKGAHMKPIKLAVASIMIVVLCGFATGCKNECDDLADVCGSCNSDYRESCDDAHNACDILKGKLGDDCCEMALDTWKSSCK